MNKSSQFTHVLPLPYYIPILIGLSGKGQKTPLWDLCDQPTNELLVNKPNDNKM